MPLTSDLRSKHRDLWERMVTHPFVTEMGDGTLPAEKFRRYFLQDYVFVNDLVSVTALGISKAPDLAAAGRLDAFLSGVLNPENDLFVRTFSEFGVEEAEYSSVAASPTTRAFGDFMVRTGYEGTFEEIVALLYVTEGTYLDWGTRLTESAARPENPIYREWIELHTPAVLGDLVAWLADWLDHADLSAPLERVERVFQTALRYEYLFWEAAYNGEEWGGKGVGS